MSLSDLFVILKQQIKFMDDNGIEPLDIEKRKQEIEERGQKIEEFELAKLKKKMINDHDQINSQYYRDLKQSDIQVDKKENIKKKLKEQEENKLIKEYVDNLNERYADQDQEMMNKLRWVNYYTLKSRYLGLKRDQYKCRNLIYKFD